MHWGYELRPSHLCGTHFINRTISSASQSCSTGNVSWEGRGGCGSGGRWQAGVGRTGRSSWCSLSASFLQPPLQLPADCGAVFLWALEGSALIIHDNRLGPSSQKRAQPPEAGRPKKAQSETASCSLLTKLQLGERDGTRLEEEKGVQGTPMYNELLSLVNKQLSSTVPQWLCFWTDQFCTQKAQLVRPPAKVKQEPEIPRQVDNWHPEDNFCANSCWAEPKPTKILFISMPLCTGWEGDASSHACHAWPFCRLHSGDAVLPSRELHWDICRGGWERTEETDPS